jgi:hypothetical protein
LEQSTYAKLGCTQGWFLASLYHPSSRLVHKKQNRQRERETGINSVVLTDTWMHAILLSALYIGISTGIPLRRDRAINKTNIFHCLRV